MLLPGHGALNQEAGNRGVLSCCIFNVATRAHTHAHTHTHTGTRNSDDMGSVAWQRQNDEMNRWHSLHARAGGHVAAEHRGGVGGGGVDGEEDTGKFKIYTGISWRSVLALVAGIKRGQGAVSSNPHTHSLRTIKSTFMGILTYSMIVIFAFQSDVSRRTVRL
jgi:hypothetical protein